MAGTRTGTSVSTRVSLFTLFAVTAAVVLVAVVSAIGVYRLVLAEDLSRVQAYRTVMVSDLDARFQAVDRLAAGISADLSARGVPSGEQALAALPTSTVDSFDALMLVDRRGNVLASITATGQYVPDAVSAELSAAPPGRTRFMWLAKDASRGAGLWVVRPVGGAGGVTVVGLVKSSSYARAADAIAEVHASMSAVIVDAERRVVWVGRGSAAIDPASISCGPGEGSGTATAHSPTAGSLSGSWASVAVDTGLGWRALVLGTEQGSMDRARESLLPASGAMLFVVLLAVVSALAYSRRLIGPLRVFETSARDAAAGGYARPIAVARDDEIGRAAGAFNDLGVRLNSLQDMARLVASAANLDDVLGAVLNAVAHILGTGEAVVLLADETCSALTLARGRGLAVPEAELVVPLDRDSPMSTAFHEQKTVRFSGNDMGSAKAIHRLFNADPHRAGVAVPLSAGSEALGVVVVLAPGHRSLTDAQIETLSAFSANAAVAVHTSRLFADERLSRTEAEALRAVAELTSPATDLHRALEAAGAIAADLLGYREWSVIVERREDLGLGAPADPAAEEVLLSVWRLVLAARPERDPADSSPIIVDDVLHEPRLSAMLGPSWGSAMFVPLLQARTARGALILHDVSAPHPTKRTIAVARAIGQQMSLAVRNAHLLQDARSRAANLETVFRISQAVSSELELNVVLDRVLDVVQKILSADAVALMSCNDRGLIETSMARAVGSRELTHFSAESGDDIPGRVYETRSPLVYGSLTDQPTRLAGLASDEGFESLLAVPLLARGRAIGVLTVFSRKGNAFSAEDMELLLTFASQAALAVDTAGLYGREHHVASVLQASILPEVLPQIAGLESGSFYLPSGTEAEIGGDYYDLFLAADGRVVLAMGDVCGKGVVAATKTSMVKYALRGAIGAGLGPAAALAELNRQVAAAGDPADIVTVWLGMLDAATGDLLYANGGHPPGLVVRHGSRAFERLSATGPLLGAISDSPYEQREVRLGVNDLLLLYTDGVTEARHGSHFFGEGRVRRALRKCDTAQGCVDVLLQAVERFSSGPLRDDAAALAVRRVSDVR